ncbi:hypothetical protein AC578_7118 [Pseudocercospora eumusae]|uniref:Uncharacterized protein n=1 Tax=Pseudocercospora eumusae TaxID=321146 RepID=A0A139HWF0_9PEZI|nr:hypothetical protein AC578_7118 [Pseudocercospora eumusae]
MRKSSRKHSTAFSAAMTNTSRASHNPAQENTNGNELSPTLIIAIDYGTKTLPIMYRFRTFDSSGNLIASPPRPVAFLEGTNSPQQVAWLDQGKGEFLWGYDLERAVNDPNVPVRRGDVIDLFKLALYKDHATSEISKRVQSQLMAVNKSMDDLLTCHLKAMVECAKAKIKDYSLRLVNVTEEVFDRMETNVFISVPQMWKPPANRRIVEATRKAGIKHVELVYEPQCAAAFYTEGIQNESPPGLPAGSLIHVNDIGNGTGDFVTYKVVADSSEGAEIQLQLVGTATGALCGSEFVNQEFLKAFKSYVARAKAKDFSALCESFNLKEIEAERAISQGPEGFEQHKIAYQAGWRDGYVTLTENLDHVPYQRQARNVRMRLKSEVMEACFEGVFQEIWRKVDNQLQIKTNESRLFLFAGGMGKSAYFLSQARQRYENRAKKISLSTATISSDYELAVPKGALLRYKNISTRDVPSTNVFGIARNEQYDAIRHPDVLERPGKRKTGMVVRNKLDRVEENPSGQQPPEVWVQECVIATEEGELQRDHLSFQVYWTESPNIQDSSPIFQTASRDTLSDGIEKWGDEVLFKLPDLHSLGYKKVETENGTFFYYVYYCLAVEIDGANVKVVLKLAKPKNDWFNAQGRFVPDPQAASERSQDYTLVQSSHNPFARENDF